MKCLAAVLCFLLVSSGIFSQPSEVKFDKITMQEGLSNNQVNCFFQDVKGFIWIGTISGLNRYDGYKMETYYYQQGVNSSLPNNTVITIGQGPADKIWIKHAMGISSYDPDTHVFSTPSYYLQLLQTDPKFITKIYTDRLGESWFAIENRGLVKIGKGDQVIQVNAQKEADLRIASNNVTDMQEDNQGNLWLVHASGTFEMIDAKTQRVTRVYGLPEAVRHEGDWRLYVDRDQDIWLYSLDDYFGAYYFNTQTGETRVLGTDVLPNTLVRGVVQSENGDIWIGVDHGGISILNKQNWKIQTIKNDPDVPKSLVNNNINILFADNDGGIWVGTTKSGISYHHRGANSFNHLKVNERRDPAYNDMSSFAEDQHGRLWIGTNGKGLIAYDRVGKSFIYTREDKRFTGPQPAVIVSLAAADEGQLWIGSYLEGLFKLDLRTFHFSKVQFSGQAGDMTSSIWELCLDSRRNVWIGTLNRGAFRYNPETGAVKNFNQLNALRADYVTSIMEDKQGDVWLGTGEGLSRVTAGSDVVRNYLSSDSTSAHISSNSVVNLMLDAEGELWVATLDGLNRYRSATDDFEIICKHDGLSSNMVMAVLEDNESNIWVSTTHGIDKMIRKPGGYDFQVFDISDGLQGEVFTEDASLKLRDGSLIFAGQNGLNIFKPDEILIGDRSPKVQLTTLTLGNTTVVPGSVINDRVLLETPIDQAQDLYLAHDENSFSLEFVALSFFQTNKIHYQYKLSGLNEEWQDVSAELRKVTFNNLNFGDYVFRVRASANPNVWNDEGIALQIHISPPFWQTPLAIALYVLSVMALIYLTRSLVLHRERAKSRVENARREIERQHQLDLMKIKFFTNVSHEFRTPLSLILTPIERMIQNPALIKTEELTLVQRNAKRLMNLVNQLLDFRKMEVNQHTLSQSSGNLVDFLQDITDSFSDMSREKNIELSFVTEVKSYYTFFDKDKMEKVMLNLLSNAFKFTLPEGKIRIDLDVQKKEDKDLVIIMVTDTGIGIPDDKKELIFNRFFQNEPTGNIINNGSGIGLSITKEFVELHGGRVYVDSKQSMGSTFVVELPLKRITNDNDVAEVLVEELRESVNRSEKEDHQDEKLPRVLLVEDNFDFRFYLKDNLKQYYNVDVASNGKEAWKRILNRLPDIVISDVMMPLMNGYELCEKIKSDPRTLQLPVILLTAQSSDQHRIQGLEAGAIEFISKPFNFEILISSINSALKFQRRVQESGNMIKAEPSEVDVVSVDEQLINRAVELIEKNMSNSEFSVEDLSHELGYSRGHFYQKILKITGQTPIDFIRNIRMKRAAELLRKSQLNVSEVAYKVGYNNPKLFSRYFKSQYQMYPSEYRNQEIS